MRKKQKLYDYSDIISGKCFFQTRDIYFAGKESFVIKGKQTAINPNHTTQYNALNLC